jgi:hypothetical protein
MFSADMSSMMRGHFSRVMGLPNMMKRPWWKSEKSYKHVIRCAGNVVRVLRTLHFAKVIPFASLDGEEARRNIRGLASSKYCWRQLLRVWIEAFCQVKGLRRLMRIGTSFVIFPLDTGGGTQEISQYSQYTDSPDQFVDAMIRFRGLARPWPISLEESFLRGTDTSCLICEMWAALKWAMENGYCNAAGFIRLVNALTRRDIRMVSSDLLERNAVKVNGHCPLGLMAFPAGMYPMRSLLVRLYRLLRFAGIWNVKMKDRIPHERRNWLAFFGGVDPVEVASVCVFNGNGACLFNKLNREDLEEREPVLVAPVQAVPGCRNGGGVEDANDDASVHDEEEVSTVGDAEVIDDEDAEELNVFEGAQTDAEHDEELEDLCEKEYVKLKVGAMGHISPRWRWWIICHVERMRNEGRLPAGISNKRLWEEMMIGKLAAKMRDEEYHLSLEPEHDCGQYEKYLAAQTRIHSHGGLRPDVRMAYFDDFWLWEYFWEVVQKPRNAQGFGGVNPAVLGTTKMNGHACRAALSSPFRSGRGEIAVVLQLPADGTVLEDVRSDVSKCGGRLLVVLKNSGGASLLLHGVRLGVMTFEELAMTRYGRLMSMEYLDNLEEANPEQCIVIYAVRRTLVSAMTARPGAWKKKKRGGQKHTARKRKRDDALRGAGAGGGGGGGPDTSGAGAGAGDGSGSCAGGSGGFFGPSDDGVAAGARGLSSMSGDLREVMQLLTWSVVASHGDLLDPEDRLRRPVLRSFVLMLFGSMTAYTFAPCLSIIDTSELVFWLMINAGAMYDFLRHLHLHFGWGGFFMRNDWLRKVRIVDLFSAILKVAQEGGREDLHTISPLIDLMTVSNGHVVELHGMDERDDGDPMAIHQLIYHAVAMSHRDQETGLMSVAVSTCDFAGRMYIAFASNCFPPSCGDHYVLRTVLGALHANEGEGVEILQRALV